MALYNEYRPATLEQIRGQDVIKNSLKAMFMSGNIPNALLFSGPRGTGKTTIARIVARFVNCENPQGDPCNNCKSCREILAGTSTDVKEVDAASNNKVEDVHQLIEDAQYAPLGNKKVYILDEVHMFSNAAWNALLKILEEPPKNVLFILCTTEEHKVPATIVSRCRKLCFERVELPEIVELMEDICEEKGVAYDKDALLLIARASEGCVRDALSILESFLDVDAVLTDGVARTLGQSGEDVVFSILENVVKGNASAAIESLHLATSRGVNLAILTKSLIGAVSDALFVNQGADARAVVNTAAYKERLAAFAPTVNEDKLLGLISELTDIYGGIGRTADAGFLMEAALLKACQYESEVEKLKARVKSLEDAMASGNNRAREVAASAIMAEPDESAAPAIADGFTDCEEPPFAEDEDDIYTDINAAFEAAVPVALQQTVQEKKPDVGEKQLESDNTEMSAEREKDVFASLAGDIEVGDEESLFDADEEAEASAKANESAAEPESDTFVKVAPDAPKMDVIALSGFLWQ